MGNRRIGQLGVCVLLAFVLVFGISYANRSAEAASPTAEEPKIEEIPIGCVVALTGFGASWGIPYRNGAMLMDGKIFVVAGKKYRIKVIAYDCKYKPELGLSAINKLIYGDKVHFLVSHATPVVAAAAPSLDKVPVLYFAWSFFQPTKLNHTWNAWPVEILADSGFYWVKKNRPEIKTLGFSSASDTSGQVSRKAYLKAAKRYGFEVVFDASYEPGTTDFYPQLSKFVAANPDALVCPGGTVGVVGLHLKQANELGWHKFAFSTSGGAIEDFIGACGKELAEGYVVVGTSDYNASKRLCPSPICSEKEHAFYKEYVKTYGNYLEGAQALYVGIELFMQAMQKAGCVGKNMAEIEKIRKVLETEEFEWIYGKTRCGMNDKYGARHIFLMPFIVLIVKHGEWVAIDRLHIDEVMKINAKLHPERVK